MSATCCLSGYVQIDELAGTTGYRRHQPWCVRSYLTGNLHREVPLKFPVRLFHTSHLPFTRCPPCCCQLCTPWHRTYTHTVKHRPTAGRLRDRWGEHTRSGRSLGGVWVNDRSWLVNPARCPLALREELSEPHVVEFTRVVRAERATSWSPWTTHAQRLKRYRCHWLLPRRHRYLP